MSDKQKPHGLKEIQTVMAVTAMATLFTLLNMFATSDRQKDACEIKVDSALANTDASMVENKRLRASLMDDCIIGTGGS